MSKNKKHVMIVDDSEDIGFIMSELLSLNSEFECSCFTSPVEALAAYNLNPLKYDAFVFDVNMPEMNGTEMAKLIASKERSILREGKIVLMSGNGDSIDHLCHRTNLPLLSKPVKIKELTEEVN